MESVKVSFEHGDFTSNNIFKIEGKLYLMDFEFSRDFQPIGFDIYDYNQSINKLNTSIALPIRLSVSSKNIDQIIKLEHLIMIYLTQMNKNN